MPIPNIDIFVKYLCRVNSQILQTFQVAAGLELSVGFWCFNVS